MSQLRPERSDKLTNPSCFPCRVQTVDPAASPDLDRLLRAFERRAGVPVLVNTSFNDADEPIVCTPRDALRTFLGTAVDALVLGDVVVTRRLAP